MKYLLLLLFPVTVSAQIITEPIKKAVSWRNSFLHNPGDKVPGLTRSGEPYLIGFNCRYDQATGAPLNAEIVVSYMNSNRVQTRVLDSCTSNPAMLWNFCMDTAGHVWVGFNYTRVIYEFNCQDDSIQMWNWGSGFGEGEFHALAYSIRLGTDYNVNFGGTSGDTYISVFDVHNRRWKYRPKVPVDTWMDYVNDIAGTPDWEYCSVGFRNNTIKLYAYNLHTDSVIELFHIGSNSRFQIEVRTGGVYVSEATIGTWKLDSGQKIWISWARNAWPVNSGTRVDKYQLNDWGQLQERSFYDVYNDTLYTTYRCCVGINSSFPPYTAHPIHAGHEKTPIRFPFFDRSNPNLLYYVSDYYGMWFRYDATTDTAVALGSMGYNLYSVIQLPDGRFFWTGYPNGACGFYDPAKPWTANTFNPFGVSRQTSDTTNPSVFWFFRNMTISTMHWAYNACNMNDSINVVAGNSQRNINGFSAGWVNFKQRDKIASTDCRVGIAIAGVAKQGDFVWYSTMSQWGGKAYLYKYDWRENAFVDSIDLGLTSYGQIYIKNDTLIGALGNRLYKVNLITKQKFFDFNFVLYASFPLENGYIGLYTAYTQPYVNSLLGTYFLRVDQYNGFPNNGMLYSLTWGNWTIVRSRNFYPQALGVATSKAQQSFLAYPNPARGSIFIQGEGEFTLMDMSGKPLRKQKGSGRMDLQGLASGVYFLNGRKIIILQ